MCRVKVMWCSDGEHLETRSINVAHMGRTGRTDVGNWNPVAFTDIDTFPRQQRLRGPLTSLDWRRFYRIGECHTVLLKKWRHLIVNEMWRREENSELNLWSSVNRAPGIQPVGAAARTRYHKGNRANVSLIYSFYLRLLARFTVLRNSFFSMLVLVSSNWNGPKNEVLDGGFLFFTQFFGHLNEKEKMFYNQQNFYILNYNCEKVIW